MLLPLFLAFSLNLLFIPVVRSFSYRIGRVAQPRQDRWHREPTPTLGGIGIFLAFLLVVVAGLIWKGLPLPAAPPVAWLGAWLGRWSAYGFFGGSALMFVLGLYDEFRPMSPSAKLVGQILAATLVIGLGYTSTFFSPRISEPLLAQIPNIVLSYIWLIGITNAINLLDNMDGLAGGISLITALALSYFFWRSGDVNLLWMALALAGAVLGFLIYNFPPAKIFMGDSGSLFIGFTLAAFAIVHQRQQASNVLAVLAVPTLLFLLPILDTGLVMFTRLLRGQSPVVGGRDHTSHRLIAFGLSERQTLFVLYAVAILSGVIAATIESLSYWLSLALAPLVIIVLTLAAAYLGGIKVVNAPAANRPTPVISRLMLDLTFRLRVLEVVLDFALIAICYYLAFLARYGQAMNAALLSLYLQSLPVALASSFLAFYISGVYRGIWRYIDFDELARFAQASLGAVILMGAIIFISSATDLLPWKNDFPRLVMVLFGLFLVLGLAATRLSFRALDRLSGAQPHDDEQAVLIYGAGDAGEIALRWIQANPHIRLRPVGFLDDDPLLPGRRIHGVEVLGGLDQLGPILNRKKVIGLILAQDDGQEKDLTAIRLLCQERGCWVRNLRLGFEPLAGVTDPVGPDAPK